MYQLTILPVQRASALEKACAKNAAEIYSVVFKQYSSDSIEFKQYSSDSIENRFEGQIKMLLNLPMKLPFSISPNYPASPLWNKSLSVNRSELSHLIVDYKLLVIESLLNSINEKSQGFLATANRIIDKEISGTSLERVRNAKLEASSSFSDSSDQSALSSCFPAWGSFCSF